MPYTKSDFTYDLPESLIARYPLENRTDSKMIVLHRDTEALGHHSFSHFMDHIGPNDLVVLNNTKVIRARFFGQKITGGKIECLVERVIDDKHALVHLKASKRPKIGAELQLEGGFEAEIESMGHLVGLKLKGGESWLNFLTAHGHMPLPPYFKREDEALDEERYQTDFADTPGAVASPTASLHIDECMWQQLEPQCATITLHVGSGTFQPVRENELSKHHMHHEWLEVSQETVDRIKATKENGGKVIAVGTTVVRALEAAAQSGELKPFVGETNLFITPGYRFEVIDKLLTNFHLPESTLLMLVSAFAGFDFTKRAYEEAIKHQYRFFSYGDAMLII